MSSRNLSYSHNVRCGLPGLILHPIKLGLVSHPTGATLLAHPLAPPLHPEPSATAHDGRISSRSRHIRALP